jgi:hypothetical protein
MKFTRNLWQTSSASELNFTLLRSLDYQGLRWGRINLNKARLRIAQAAIENLIKMQ